MNTDPVIHADAVDAYHAVVEQLETAYVTKIIASCQQLDANAIAGFAPMTTDWERQGSKSFAHGQPTHKRAQTLSEVLAGSLVERGPGPSMTNVMQLFIKLAYSAEPQAVMAQQARDLLGEMAQQAASNDVTVED
jgi:hypothetical protein